jgi:hypothetical protein
MFMYPRSIWLILLVAALCGAALAADRVVLKNGDIITGSIVKKDGAKLTIRSEFLGEVSMPWTAVQSLQSDDPVTVTLPSGTNVAGRLSSSGESLQVTTAAGVERIPFAAVGAIRNPAEQAAWERMQHPGLLQLWAGFFDIGLALARGNARTDTLSTAFNATRVSRKDKIGLHFNQIRGTARVRGQTSTIANAIRGGWSYNRDIAGKVFLATLNDYEYDPFQQLDLRFVAGAGLGYNAIKKPNTSVSILAGSNYSRENFFNGVIRNSAEANFGDDVQYKLNSSASISQSFRFYTNLSETGQYRVSFDLGAATVIRKWLAWQVSASDRFISNPVGGRQRNDLLLSTGFRLNFAR